MKIQILATICLGMMLINGCSAPKVVKLDGDSLITINEDLLRYKKSNLPLDPFLKVTNWTYSALISKTKDGYILENDDVVKVFLVAHNADRIILNGTADMTKEIKQYFIDNGVKANIEISIVDSIKGSKKIVNALFFHEKKE